MFLRLICFLLLRRPPSLSRTDTLFPYTPLVLSRLGIGPRLDQPQGDLLDTGLELRVGAANRAVSLGITNLFDTRGNRFALGSPFLVGEAVHKIGRAHV